MHCGKCETEGIKKLEEPLQGIYCIDCISYCPECETIMPEWVLECNEGMCMNCAVHGYSEGKYVEED